MTQIKKAYYSYGNWDYPKLKHWPVRVIASEGEFRMTEKMFEYLYREYGYLPAPEIALERKIQIKRWWGWKTLYQHSFRTSTNEVINQAFLGYRYDHESSWEEVDMGINRLIQLNTQYQKNV